MAYLNVQDEESAGDMCIFDYEYELVWLLGLPMQLVAPGQGPVGFLSKDDFQRLNAYRRVMERG